MKIEIDKSKRRILIVVGVLFALVILWAMFRTSPVQVETATAEKGDMLVTVDGEGKTRYRDKQTVAAPLSGLMARVKLREGDFISKDYVITEIDPNPATPRPPSETENRINPWAQKVYAPVTGKVLRILVKDPRILQAGTPIIEIGNPDVVEVVVDVLSTEAAQVRPGATVLIDTDTSAEPIKARVRTVEPQAFTKISSLGVEEQRVNIIIDFQTKNVRFGDNFRVDVRIIVWHSENVLKIPSSALFRNGERWNVFVVEWGTAKQRDVSVAHQTSAESEILDGLSEGENVILHPPKILKDGAPVRTR